MSKPNKANRNNYIQAGRLTPDDIARERKKQRLIKESGAQTASRRGQSGVTSRTGPARQNRRSVTMTTPNR